MLNKYLFGLLVNTIAIFASISSDVVATEGLHKCRNQLNQIYWVRYCSWEEFLVLKDRATKTNEYQDQYWILEPEYKDSRTKVIVQAIADCVTGEKEFKDKNAGDIITFKDTNPETYKQKHWNAVILYNYIHEAINRKDIRGWANQKNWVEEDNFEREYCNRFFEVNKVLEKKFDTIKAYYENYYTNPENGIKNANELIQALPGKLNNAIKHIQAYVEALELEKALYKFALNKLIYVFTLDIRRIAPDVDAENFNDKKLIFRRYFYKFDENSPDIRWIYDPTFSYRDGKLFIAKLDKAEENWDKAAKDGKGDWVRSDNPITYLDIAECQENGKWLLDRLGSLLYSPTKNIIEKWAEEDEAEKKRNKSSSDEESDEDDDD